MLEEEFFELSSRLKQLEYRIPHKGISFRYGPYIVNASNDLSNKVVYSVKKQNDTYSFETMYLYPVHNSDIGFDIRDSKMSFHDSVRFINEIHAYRKIPNKVSIHEGYLIELLKKSSTDCPICMEEYTSESEIKIYSCGHSAHSDCAESYLNGTKCSFCRN